MSKFAGSLDTNALLRLLLNDVPSQRNAVKRLLETHRKQFAVADIALFEMAFVLQNHYEFSCAEVASALHDIMAIHHFNCNRALFTRALKLFVEHRTLSLEDCALVCYAEINEATPLYTFDKKLTQRTDSAQPIAN